MKTKIQINIIMILTLGLLLISCAPTAEVEQPELTEDLAEEEEVVQEEKKIVVAYSHPQLIDKFQLDLRDGLVDEAKELGIELLLVDSENKVDKQAADMEDIISQGVDLILVAAMDADAIVPSIEQANAAGIPVMTIDRGANGGEVLSHSALDNYCFAYRGIEYASSLVDKQNPKILVLEGTAGMSVVTWNSEGAEKAIQDFGLESVGILNADWDTALGLSITEDTLTTHPDLDIVYCGYDGMCVGALQALRARDLAGDVIIVSGGYEEGAQNALAEGVWHGELQFMNYEGARVTLQAAYDYLVNGIEPSSWTAWPLVLHTSDGQLLDVDCPIEGWNP